MTNRTKAIIAGAAVGAIATTVAIVCFVKKHVVIAKVHLFDPAEQDEAKIEDLIPKPEGDKCNCEEHACVSCSCNKVQGEAQEAEV